LDVRQYISVRVDDQVNYYQLRARLDQSRLSFWRRAQSVILAFAVVLTAGSLVIREFSALIPVLATTAVAIVAFMGQSGKQRLIELYWSASQQLTLARAEWLASGKTDQDKDDRDAFIARCETILLLENGGWTPQFLAQGNTSNEAPSSTTPPE
jgi:hypothetical protein